MKTVYLASPLGFSPEWKSYRDKVKRRLTDLGCTVLDPWEGPFGPAIAEASTIQDWPARVAAFRTIAAQIGKANEEMIRSCDLVLGVLRRDRRSRDQLPFSYLFSRPSGTKRARNGFTGIEIAGDYG